MQGLRAQWPEPCHLSHSCQQQEEEDCLAPCSLSSEEGSLQASTTALHVAEAIEEGSWSSLRPNSLTARSAAPLPGPGVPQQEEGSLDVVYFIHISQQGKSKRQGLGSHSAS